MRRMRLASTAAACAIAIMAGACGHSRASTWHPKAEDDYPACWETPPDLVTVTCGPLWAMDPGDIRVPAE